MDYSQFLLMHHEIGLLAVFLLVFLFDTFFGEGLRSRLTYITVAIFGVFTVYSFLAPLTSGEAFAGM